MQALRAGDVSAGLMIPADIEKRFYNQGTKPLAHLIVDGSDTVMAAALKSLGMFPFHPDHSVSMASMPTSIAVELLYNPEQRSALFTVLHLVPLTLSWHKSHLRGKNQQRIEIV